MINTPLVIAALDKEGGFSTIAEAARLLRVSQATIWRWIDAGKLPAYRIGPRRILIKTQDLEIMVQPVQRREVREVAKEHKETDNIWAGYDAREVKKVVAQTAGSWADLDTGALITELYREREQGSRPDSRP
jgi:excisionase family DNA binding protein